MMIGHVGQDPEITQLSNGSKMAKFSLAVSEKWTDRNGEKQTRTEWVSFVCFTKLSDVIETWVKKGQQLFCEGSWMTNEWENDAGEKRSRVEVKLFNMTMLGSKTESGAGGGYASTPASTVQTPPPTRTADSPNPEETDDLPF